MTDSGENRVVVARWSELDDRVPAHARVAETDLVVVRSDDDVRVLYGRCTHRGALMADGRVEGDDLVCAMHGWDYRLDTGVSALDPCESLHRFGAQIDRDGDRVFVDADEVRRWSAAHPSVFDEGEITP